MMVLKCKMCGGDIQVGAEQNYGVCEYCGGAMTLPRVSDERRANLFNRANHFRRQNEFDKALEAYENILNEDNSDAEAHWGVTLCRYGIEYVEDPRTRGRVPTCRRAQYESILADPDYLAALEHAPDGYARGLYEQEAKTIAEIQKGILAISQKEEPFDVFICYKETDDGGARTKDSVIAQDVYYQLTQAGYKVFFSRITLESKLGSAYEPYIFSALNSARVMVAIGTRAEHFNAVWVKNEWSRYLALMKKDRNRLLIPCYQGMDPYDMPQELSFLQAQDMGKIGFIQDLIRGVQKVLSADKTQSETASPSTAESGRKADVDALLKRADLFLQDGDFEKADEYFDRVLDLDPECAKAYMGKYLTENKFRSEENLVSHFAESFKKQKTEALQLSLQDLKQETLLTTLEVNYATRGTIGYLYRNGALDKEELDRWLYSGLRYVPVSSVVDEVKRKLRMPDADSNYQKALRFATASEKQSYSGHLERIRGEIEEITKSAEREDNESLPLLKNCYANYLGKIIPLLWELQKLPSPQQMQEKKEKIEKKIMTALLFCSAVVLITSVAFAATGSGVIVLLSFLPLAGVCQIVQKSRQKSRQKIVEEKRQEIYRSLHEATLIIDNDKALSFGK
ncbi:MAG: TIR domain-containing protein [Synergistaceae bacterium]|jgi:tetratricopeptide (TPR) repeat protein|nr:TIR domain-containing protein [Synergistaceae bacterium]